jgi:hypothetical protein
MFRQILKSPFGIVGGCVLWAVSSSVLAVAAKPVPPVAAQPEQLLTPEQALPAPRAQIQPVNGRVTLKLINKTNALINYQAVGDTAPRTLGGNTSITLQNLKTPMTLTIDREDRGFLDITPKVLGRKANTLEMTLEGTSNFSLDKTTVRIEKSGLVFLY